MIRVWRSALDALFPLRCGLCGLMADAGICPECLGEFKRTEQPIVRLGEREPVQLVASLYEYEGRMAQAIQRFKYERVTSLADPLADLLMAGTRELDLPPFDFVLPVPIHWRRLCWRGFNQADLLAKHLIPAGQESALLRIRATRPQVGLSAVDRLSNLDGAFRASDVVKGRTVLMVDDVYTSGSTARACGISLRVAGASYVGILTLASGDDLRAP